MWIKNYSIKKNKSIKNIVTPELMVSMFIIIIGGYILFSSPIIGLSDNGDFYKIMKQNGLYYLQNNETNDMFGYFNRQYGIYKYANEETINFFSSQSIFIKLAIFLSKIFNKNNIFDIRFLSIIFLSLHAIAGYYLVKVFTKDIKVQKFKYAIGLLYTFIFCDIAYIAYFNSFHIEALIITCFLLSVAILLYMIKFNKINLINGGLFIIVSLILFTADYKLTLIGVLFTLLIIRVERVSRRKHINLATLGFGILLIIGIVTLHRILGKDFNYINKYHVINRGILMNEEDPERVLKEFGINSSYSLLEGETFYEKVPSINPMDEKLINDYYKNISTLSICTYYLKHPKKFSENLKVGINNAYSIRTANMGNYEKDEGKPYGSKSYFFSGWSILKNNKISRNVGFFIIFNSIYFILSFKMYKKSFNNRDINRCLFEEAYLYIFLAGFSQIIISVILSGDANITKNVFLYNLTFDLMIIKLVAQYLIDIEKNEEVENEQY